MGFKKKKSRKHKSTKIRCRTAKEIEEEQTRTLYVRLPKTIKDVKEVESLLVGEFKIKLQRQSGRHCHVIFPSIEDKVKNLKHIKQQLVNGKPVYAAPPKPVKLDKPKKLKKIKIPDPSIEPKVTKYLFVTNLPPGIKAPEVKEAFSGSTTVVLLKGLVRNTRQAKIKMSSSHVSLRWVKSKSDWPVFKGIKCKVSLATVKIKPKKKESESLKMYEGESESKDDEKSSDKEEEKPSEDKENKESESSDEEQSDLEEIEVESSNESAEDEEEDDEEEEEEDEEEQEDVKSEEESSD